MGYAPIDEKYRVTGSFVVKETGKRFEYCDSDQVVFSSLAHGGKEVAFCNQIFVGPDGEKRYAFVGSTVVHVIVDETDKGWVVQKWKICQHR
jgi:hypothetical protein